MVNIIHLYTAVAVMCLTGAVPPEEVLSLFSTFATSLVNLIMGVAG
jgi:hypothetical protein